MKLERSKNTKRNIVIGEIDKISGIILPFIVRTMIIHLIGAEYLGLTSLYYSILQALNLVEMGFGTAIIYSLYKPIAEEDTDTINALLRFYQKIYRISGCIILGLGLIIMLFLPFLIKDEPPEDINIYYLYLIYLVNTCINFFVYPNMKALVTAHQRDDLSGRIHIFTQLGMYIMQMVFIYFARDYYLYALMMPVSSLIYSILCGRMAEKRYPDYRPNGELDEELYKSIKKQVAGLLIRKLAILSRNAIDSIFVSAYLGLKITAIYNNYYYILDAVVMIIAVVKTSMAGGVGNSIATESVEKNLGDMKKIDFLFMLIGGWCAAMLLCLYQPFMKLWVGEEMMLTFKFAALFSIYFYILKMSDIRTLYSESVGIWWQGRYLSIIEAVSNILLNWIFVKNWGIFGIVLATMISYGVFNLIGGVVLLYKHYFVSYKMQKYFVNQIKYLIITMCAGVATFFASKQIGMEGFWGILLKGLVCVIIPGVIYFLIYFKTEEFKKALGFVKIIKNGNN